MSKQTLSPKQEKAAALLAGGMPVGEVAKAVDVDPRTLYAWRTQVPIFMATVNRGREAQLEETRDQLRAAGAKAVATLTTLLESPDETSRLKAASLILDRLDPFNFEGGAAMGIGSTTEEGCSPHCLGVRSTIPLEEELAQSYLVLLELFLAGKKDAATTSGLLGCPMDEILAAELVHNHDKLLLLVRRQIDRQQEPAKRRKA